jgi:hypothetical protein
MESALNLNVPKVFNRISELDTGETDNSLEPREMLALAAPPGGIATNSLDSALSAI